MPFFCLKEESAVTLEQFFFRHPKAALAFSGGADSAYLLYAALENGAETGAYYSAPV